MARGKLAHLQVNVKQENLPFYRELLTELGWEPVLSADWAEAFQDVNGVSVWFIAGAKDVQNDYDGPGVNHIAFTAESQAAVDATVSWLNEQEITCLFETPRHRPDFAQSGDHTYYQVMFESPDCILFEHVYIGPK